MLHQRLAAATVLIAVLAIAPGQDLNAQTVQTTGPTGDAFSEALFAPDLVMQHAREIALTADQRTAITAIIQELQGQAVALQLQMVEAMQATIEELEKTRIDEAAALASTRRVLALEQDVKTTQLQMLIRIKNTLTVDQQARLGELRRHRHTGAR